MKDERFRRRYFIEIMGRRPLLCSDFHFDMQFVSHSLVIFLNHEFFLLGFVGSMDHLSICNIQSCKFVMSMQCLSLDTSCNVMYHAILLPGAEDGEVIENGGRGCRSPASGSPLEIDNNFQIPTVGNA
jgi:hypothetical protein